MVHLVKHDLEFILKQIKIGEANSVAHSGGAAKPLTDLVSHHLLPYGLRTVNGSYNNLIPGHEWSGSADQVMPRLTDPYYVEADAMPAGLHGPNSPAGTTTTHYGNNGSVYDSDPRVISNLISDQTIGNPATIIAALTNLGHEDPYAFLASGTNMAVYQAAVDAYKASEAVEKALAIATANVTAKQMALARLPQGATEEQRQAAQTAIDDAIAAKDAAKTAVDAAAEVKDAAYTDMKESLGVEMEGDTVVIPNVAADLGDTAPFNGFFTLFGQFFDHGLDLVSKGENGTVFIPLQPDDPLYVPGSPTNFMVVTRATPVKAPGADGQIGTADDVFLGHRNETTPWIDLNQVYTSNPSHQVFLREYVLVDGKPVATGRMLEGANGGPATWADVKQQAAEKLGIILTDADVLRVPALLTDMYGEFVRGANGFPQLVTANGAVEGNTDAPVAASQAVSAGRAFLNDIAHNAAPVLRDLDGDPTTPLQLAPDADDVANGGPIQTDNRGNNLFYDNEFLDRHVIVGDGRGNENIGLTSVHHVFHHEHNRIIEETKKIALETGDLAFLNEWLAVDVTAMPTTQDEIDNLVWDGERLFQAARFSTEMVYQHLVFEEFARAVAPDVDPFLFSNTTTVDGAIVAEFAHVVYRFGHSMLTDTIDMINVGADGSVSQSEMGLIEAFLNPIAFAGAGVNAQDAAGAILNGMSRQVGNEIDEHITDALRNNLVGLPLDLGATNIARARETGVPSLNEARRQFYEDTGDTRVKPYESWHDFALSLKNPASLINFIAAYGTHASIKNATTAEAKRDAAMKLIFGDNSLTGDEFDAFEAERMAFLHGQGQFGDTATGRLGGLNDVDFWIGGLAEKKMTFGSMLGSSFTYVFEFQMEQLQAGDRFYYLSRVQGLNLLNELEADSFAQLLMRNTSLGNGNAPHINGSAFQTADVILEMDESRQIDEDPEHTNPILQAISPKVIRKDVDNDGDTDYLRYTGTDHAVLGGTDEDDTLIGGEGDDTLWGDGGDDRLEGGYGVDHLHGGDGDDIITDSGTDIGAADVIHGDAGNDVINPGSGLDLVFGGSGQDFIYGGTEAKTVNGGLDSDFIRGGTGISMLVGNEGDDWIEGGESFDTLAGENSELFFNSTIIGHDVLNGRGNDNDYDAESGDDIMFQNEGIERNNGMAGFDWAIHKGHDQGADSDMTVSIFQNQQNNILRDRFDLVEGLSGWKHDDKLTGREVVVGAYDEFGNATQVNAGAPLESYSNALLEKNLHLIDGLADLVAHLTRTTVTGADGKTETVVMGTGDASDILLGGGGSDTIQGNAGDDIIDGDKWLNVRIRITVKDAAGNETIYTADGMDSKIYLEAEYDAGAPVPGATAQFGGKTLQQTMFDRTLNPGQLSIVREIVNGGQEGDVDTAVFFDVMANYTITRNEDGSIDVEHNANVDVTDPPVVGGDERIRTDGKDRLSNIEVLKFADGEIRFQKPELALHAFDDGQYLDQFGSGSYTNSNGETPWTSPWQEELEPTTNATTSGTIRITNGALQFHENQGGAAIQRSLDLDGATSARMSFRIEEANLDAGETVRVLFSADGGTPVLVDTISGATNTVPNRTIDLTGPFGPNAFIRFESDGFSRGFGQQTESVRIDNVAVSFVKPAAEPSVNYATTFTEGNTTGVAIADLPGIVDNDAQLASATIVLTNKKDGDVLVVGTLPPGIVREVDNSVPGKITVTLSGAASLAAYQAAIQAVTFQNTSNQPNTEARVIQVTVNDGFLDSNTAVTTVNVVAVNSAPTAENDSIITNVASGTPFLVPGWALLANDTDAEGAALDITGASNQSGLSAVSWNQATGTVSVTDNATANGTFTYTVNDSSGAANATDTATVNVTRVTTAALNGTTADNIMVGNDAANAIDAGRGNDTVFGGGGNDTIVWNVDTGFFGNETGNDGRDFVDGGAGTLDRFVVNGGPSTETFTVYARADAIAAGFTDLKADTEIVITRRVGNTTSVIAELDNIEEITINTGPGNDTVRTVGDFRPTSLSFNTITINGTEGDDTVDITALQSAHRIYFRTNGGNDTIVGTLRPQDVVVLPNGAEATDYEVTTDENGLTTMTRDGHKLTFVCEDGLPQFGSDDGHDDEEETPPGNDDGDTGSDEGDDDDVTNPGGDDEEDDESCGHDDEGDGAGTGNNGGGTTPPVTQPDTSVGAPIAGTNATEVLVGTSKGETIMALDGNDNVVAGAGADVVNGGAGSDFLSGEAGRDVMFGGDGDDNMLGGDDADMLYGDAGNDRVFGDAGDDMIDAGAGNDTVYGGAGNDLIVASANDGNDVYYGDDMTGGTGTDTLDMSAITANITANLGANGGSGSVFSSQSGSDTIWGVENIVTGSGNDTITANHAVNVIDGGAGNDTFRFLSAADANGDTILGFQPGDRLDLSAIDANGGAAGKQAFTLANGSSFTGPAQLVISHETRDDGDYTVVSGNVTGPDAAEFKISLKGNHDLKASDFVLS